MAETLLYQGVAVNPANGLRVRLGFHFATLAGNFTVTPQTAQFISLISGASRQVNMPLASASQGLFFRIHNRAAALSGYVLNIHDAAGDAFSPAIEIAENTAGFIVCNGTTWKKLK